MTIDQQLQVLGALGPINGKLGTDIALLHEKRTALMERVNAVIGATKARCWYRTALDAAIVNQSAA